MPLNEPTEQIKRLLELMGQEETGANLVPGGPLQGQSPQVQPGRALRGKPQDLYPTPKGANVHIGKRETQLLEQLMKRKGTKGLMKIIKGMGRGGIVPMLAMLLAGGLMGREE
jgi:hypothetical protein